MPFTVTITKSGFTATATEVSDTFQTIYSQTVEDLNLVGVIHAINTPPPAAPVPKKVRKDKGVKRLAKTEVPA